MLNIARIAIKKNAAFSDCIVVFGVKPYIVAFFYLTKALDAPCHAMRYP